MKIIGTSTFDANRTTMTNSLAAALLTRPEISNNVVNLFEDNFTCFSSYLARKGYTKKGITPGFSSDSFKVIGNSKFMWSLKGYPFRKGEIVEGPGGFTVTDSAGNSTATPGIGGSMFIFYTNTNYFSPNDNLELEDRRTIIQFDE